MRKSLYSSVLMAAVVLALGCKRHNATESEQTADTAALRVDTSVTQPDRTNVEPDSIPSAGAQQPENVPRSSGGAARPGARPKPKPGQKSNLDSIKASYPPKKQ